jgi:hypothetical protein
MSQYHQTNILQRDLDPITAYQPYLLKTFKSSIYSKLALERAKGSMGKRLFLN